MAIDIYLTHYKDITGPTGKKFYYFRAVGLPTNWQGDLLINLIYLLRGDEIYDFFNIPGHAPDNIPAGQKCWGSDGSPWTAPANLAKSWVQDYAFSTGGLGPSFNEIIGRQPWVIYTEIDYEKLPLVPADLPADVAGPAAAVQSEGYGPYIPPGWTLSQIIISSTHADYPVWSYTYFQQWYAYGYCEYNCEDYPGHVTCRGNELWLWQENVIPEGGWQYGTIYWKHEGHAYNIHSCLEGPGNFLDYDIWHEQDGDYASLNAYVIRPLTPVCWFNPPIFGDEIEEQPSIHPIISLPIIEKIGIYGGGYRAASLQPWIIDNEEFQVDGESFEVYE
jgi:hypothetical protein